MRANRRGILKAAGGLTVLATAAGVWRVLDTGVLRDAQGPAYAPWDDWRSGMNEGPLALVRAAILAASPCNSQPWRFRVFPTRIELHADPVRSLGASDPFLREMHLGLGCALENMLLAARPAGYSVELTLASGRLDQGASTPGLIATLQLHRAEVADEPLAAVIADRHTHRGSFDPDRPLSPETLSSIASLSADIDGVRVVLFTDAEQRAAFAAEVQSAAEAVLEDEEILLAENAWCRTDRVRLQSERDGLAPDTEGASGVVASLAMLLPDPGPRARFQTRLTQLRDVQLPSSPAFGLLAVRDLYDLGQTLGAGRAWQRLHLWATRAGLALQPLNVPIERVDRERALGREPATAQRLAGFTGDPAWQPTFAFRAGYPLSPAVPSPRRPVEWVLLQPEPAAYTPA